MDNPLGIPFEDLPEPIRRILELARARGDEVKVVKLPNGDIEGDIRSQVMEIGESEDAQTQRLQCGCAWCKLEYGVAEVNKTTELDRDQKYEAVIKLFTDAGTSVIEAGETSNGLSMLMQATHYVAHKENRDWMLEQVKTRLNEEIFAAAREFGIDEATPEGVLTKMAEATVAKAKTEGRDAMMRSALLSLKLKDLLRLKHKLEGAQTHFQVHRVPLSELSERL